MNKIIAVIILNIISISCYASMNIPNQAPTGMSSFYEGVEQGNRWANNMMAQAQARDELQLQRQESKMYQLQIEERKARYMSYLAAHPQIAKDIADQHEVQDIIERNSGIKSIFKSRKSYCGELNQCANHGNKYCANLLNRELSKTKRVNS